MSKIWVEQFGSQFWNPKTEGEELVGSVVKVKRDPEFGFQYVLLCDNGEQFVTPSHKLLQARMMDIIIGDRVKLVFKGELPSKDPKKNPTRNYKVYKEEEE